MKHIPLEEIKNNLDVYVEKVKETHEPIVICKDGQPVANLVEHKALEQPKPFLKKRILGGMKGKITIHPDFYKPLELI